jgi:hypothetical protein
VALRIDYKNDETMKVKRIVFGQKKEEARRHFASKEYLEALKIYKFL